MRLSPRPGDIFLSHRVDGLSYGGIADGMGLSVKGSSGI
jgi:DNA-directed RNA polymerase specialized sigma24 family protein